MALDFGVNLFDILCPAGKPGAHRPRSVNRRRDVMIQTHRLDRTCANNDISRDLPTAQRY